MKKQRITHASIASSATNFHLKGLQQFFTPEAWARALGGALPEHRRTVADLHCGDGSLVRGLANNTTREALGCDLDPAAGLGRATAWTNSLPGLQAPLRTFAHGDVLDLYPLLAETNTRFDLLALNPPFSLTWPLALIPEPLRNGLTGKIIDSTHATLRMLPELLTPLGEALVIANGSTLDRLKEQYPEDFEQVWLHLDIPSFFPGVSPTLRVGALYFTGEPLKPLERFVESWDARLTPDETAAILDRARRKHFTAPCVEQPWDACADTGKRFLACCDELERRRNPSSSGANVTLDADGRIRTWVSAYQEKSVAIPPNMIDFLRSLNRKLPLELTLQRGARLALQQAMACGFWTVDSAAAAAIAAALEDFDRDRAPLTPISDTQRIGWIDDAEELLCTRDFDHFRAGERYPLSTETIEWKKEELRPRYHAGKRDTETVLVRGRDLRLTLHHPSLPPVHFIFNPDRLTDNSYSLEELAAHFELPEVKDITTLHPERLAENLVLLAELEAMTL
ncbi:MAG: hypothetical protein V4819_16400 [Verrucomicrobiota bacterium]